MIAQYLFLIRIRSTFEGAVACSVGLAYTEVYVVQIPSFDPMLLNLSAEANFYNYSMFDIETLLVLNAILFKSYLRAI